MKGSRRPPCNCLRFCSCCGSSSSVKNHASSSPKFHLDEPWRGGLRRWIIECCIDSQPEVFFFNVARDHHQLAGVIMIWYVYNWSRSRVSYRLLLSSYQISEQWSESGGSSVRFIEFGVEGEVIATIGYSIVCIEWVVTGYKSWVWGWLSW